MREPFIYIDGTALDISAIDNYASMKLVGYQEINYIIDELMLEMSDFDNEIIMEYRFSGDIFSYGGNDDITILDDFLIELEKLASGLSHDIEIAGYPVGFCQIDDKYFSILEYETSVKHSPQYLVFDFSQELKANAYVLNAKIIERLSK